MTLVPVIICGGSGSRLWPVSRTAHPKPFIELPDGGNLIRKTYSRALALNDVTEVLTITNRDLYFKTLDEYVATAPNYTNLGFVLEPFGRNTAAAVALAAQEVARTHGPDAIMLVLPADHLIDNQAAFAAAVESASQQARDGWLVTFGVKPEYPETGYGYIQKDTDASLVNGFKVKRFVEKPDLDTAKDYLASGEYYWNSGMFCFRAGTLIEEMALCAPDVASAVDLCLAGSGVMQGSSHRSLHLEPESFAKVPDISLDFALMERSNKVATIPCDIGWSDIGSWKAMSELSPADEQGNRIEGEAILHASTNNYVRSQRRLAALVGVENLIIVDTPDALLVAHKDHAQDIKVITAQLKKNGHCSHLDHTTVQRPWGAYTTLEEGTRFKIKRIVVKPQGSLSLQMHHHRSEHWIVVSGMALVVNDQQRFLLNTNESTYIRAGHTHRLQNPGMIDLVLIEVQCGDYLGEDDIVRFEDSYGRAEGSR
ncbi:mannose-1-phosphate guanylyltransferase/mannose-6-phosphate isomerase [Pseudomonas protegens]|mgnify:CR=1 FL=1|uniref:Alginate biosynthesis protein AlgA n=1 Tax=Pseudomonas protegens (strain DSM 19095 / LMG 27888 / CFBP 6595 / CHA0) TaxID=1124983 RepID=A0A2C9EJH3_PSEPH|nr:MULTISPECIES: mannose-1-phosphate guanylyltransferase/mannose-6-phosphate isomerase [Pseudomonas]GED78538.1 mannose-1-phosphate guanylyltransferase/mannose-6-phosphate isomerase [Pseudomonas fluorescens]AGL83749.1 alginate biosynthesis protein AlgA [Pseudomonas protegens CHA0]AQT08750.1 mannose-6-phosphate isomerase [Pseudomonas protegens]MBB1614326.1 mannose-1-phosphate guanylyltransferase/mannose-6-phosphate isomerase [Pseudomonas sp. UMC65]MBB1617702.1 mannose-1-phosphate guanylyltransfe